MRLDVQWCSCHLPAGQLKLSIQAEEISSLLTVHGKYVSLLNAEVEILGLREQCGQRP